MTETLPRRRVIIWDVGVDNMSAHRTGCHPHATIWLADNERFLTALVNGEIVTARVLATR